MTLNRKRVSHEPPRFSAMLIQEDGGCQIVSAFGEVDLSTAGELEELVNRAVSRAVGSAGSTKTTKDQEPGLVVVDLAGITFMDVVGLGVLVRASRELEDTAGRRLSVVCAERVERLFELAGVTKAVDVHPDLVSAVAP